MSEDEDRDKVAKDKLLKHQEQIEMAKTLHTAGHSIGKIAKVMRISQSTVRILMANVKECIWYTGEDYEPRTDGQYGSKLAEIEPGELVFLVRKRVDDDLVLAVPNGWLGDDKNISKIMVGYVINHDNVVRCILSVAQENKQDEYTVDWVCRKLAQDSMAFLT